MSQMVQVYVRLRSKKQSSWESWWNNGLMFCCCSYPWQIWQCPGPHEYPNAIGQSEPWKKNMFRTLSFAVPVFINGKILSIILSIIASNDDVWIKGYSDLTNYKRKQTIDFTCSEEAWSHNPNPWSASAGACLHSCRRTHSPPPGKKFFEKSRCMQYTCPPGGSFLNVWKRDKKISSLEIVQIRFKS